MKKPLLLVLCFMVNSLLLSQNISQNLLSGMQARSIGPAGMSGRITAIDVVLENPDIWYIGTASGGLWQTKNGGIDKFP